MEPVYNGQETCQLMIFIVNKQSGNFAAYWKSYKQSINNLLTKHQD